MIKVGFITNYFIFLFSKSKQPPIRTLKKTVRWVIGIILGIYIGTIILLNIPYIQRNMTTFVTKELSRTLGTELTIGKIDIGLLNRIIIDDVLLDDQSGKEMLKILPNLILFLYSTEKSQSAACSYLALIST